MAVAALALAFLAVLAYSAWRERQWDRERTRLTNLVVSRDPISFAALQKASGETEPPPAKPAEAAPKPKPIGL